jgi:hypothetical protein
LDDLLKEKGGSLEVLHQRIRKELIKPMMKSVAGVIDPHCRKYCLEFVGVDIMVDET